MSRGAVRLAAVIAGTAALSTASAAPAQEPAAPAAASVPTPVATARPGRTQIVGILEVRVDGVSPAVAERFEASIEEGLSSAELRIATRKRLREMLAGSTWSDGCLFGPCLAEVREQTDVDRVVVAYFQGRGSSYRFVVSLVDTATGKVRAQAAERCEVCTLTEALDGAVLATIGLVHGAAPDGDPPSVPRGWKHRVRPRTSDPKIARRTALLLAGVGAIVGGAGLYFLAEDRDRVGYASIGGASALVVASGVMLGVSFSFD